MNRIHAFSILALLSAPVFADVHHFGYITETGTLPAGATEVELWNTARIGRDAYYYRLDQRLEVEAGVTDKLQASLYLNWNRITEADTSGALGTVSDLQGLSAELKYRFSDASTDAVGFGLYGELGFNSDAMEIEGKALFGKDVDGWIFAANLNAEAEIENRGMNLIELELQPVIGVAYEITSAFTAGLELRNHNELEKNDETGNKLKWMNSTLYLGPSIAYSAKSFVVTFTVLPQLPALKTEDGTTFELHDHEKVEARLHLSVHF